MLRHFPGTYVAERWLRSSFNRTTPVSERGNFFFVSTPYLRKNFLTPTFWYFILVPPIATATELVTKQTFWRFSLAFLFCVHECTSFNLLTEVCAIFCVYFVCAFCSHGKFNYIVTNTIRESFSKLVSREQSPESKCVEGVTMENEMPRHGRLKNLDKRRWCAMRRVQRR
jgi:hypothetical protein